MDSGPLVKANASMIREVQPASPFDFHGTAPPLHPWIQPQESPLREYLRVLIKRKWTVLGCLATIFTVVAIASLKMVPIYEAAGSIAINKPDSSLVNFKDSAGGSVDYSDPTTDMDTEVALLQSGIRSDSGSVVQRQAVLDSGAALWRLDLWPLRQSQSLRRIAGDAGANPR